MRTLLVAFHVENAARLLVSFLKSKSIAAEYQFQSDPQAHMVLLVNQEQLEQAKTLCEEFIHAKEHGKYQDIAWQSEPVTTLTNSSLGIASPNLNALKHAPFTYLVLVASIVVYFISLLGGFGWVIEQLRIVPVDNLLVTQQWWRLFTPALIHFSEVHIIFNLLWWWYLGKQIEQKLGTFNLMLLFLFSSCLSNYAQLIVSGGNFGGMSGVVYSVIGYVWWLGWLAPRFNLFLPKAIVGICLVWLVLGYLDVLWVPMANTAHTIGLITGCISAWLYSIYFKP